MSVTGRIFRAGLIAVAPSFVAALVAPVGLPASLIANACKLVTAADAREALGAAVRPSVLVNLGIDESCRYSTTTMSKTLSVAFHPLSKSDFAKLVEADGLTPLPGIAGSSYTAPGGITVWKNGIQATFVVNPPGAVSLRAEKQLANRVIARL